MAEALAMDEGQSLTQGLREGKKVGEGKGEEGREGSFLRLPTVDKEGAKVHSIFSFLSLRVKEGNGEGILRIDL
jgi:hypothetical protein